MKYNKLVRDRIPELIKKKGKTASTHIANNKEYWEKLKIKLREEVDEFLGDNSLEEMADILEVIDSIKEIKNFNEEELQSLKLKKLQERGGFKSRIILDEIK